MKTISKNGFVVLLESWCPPCTSFPKYDLITELKNRLSRDQLDQLSWHIIIDDTDIKYANKDQQLKEKQIQRIKEIYQYKTHNRDVPALIFFDVDAWKFILSDDPLSYYIYEQYKSKMQVFKWEQNTSATSIAMLIKNQLNSSNTNQKHFMYY